jgi:hypothetical protein
MKKAENEGVPSENRKARKRQKKNKNKRKQQVAGTKSKMHRHPSITPPA